MNENEIKTTNIDNEEYYLVPTDEYELVDADEETEDDNDNGVQLSSVLLGAGLAATAGLIGFGIKKLVTVFKKKSKKSAENEKQNKVLILDSETDEVIAEFEDDED